jgi:hypothetical protein
MIKISIQKNEKIFIGIHRIIVAYINRYSRHDNNANKMGTSKGIFI